MPSLFDPIKFRSITLKNRIVVSPMCQYSSVDGFANDWHLVHLGTRAIGGAGLVFTEATSISEIGRISPEDLGIWKDDHIIFLKRITSFIKAQHSVPGIQLAHAGRKASHQSPWNGNKAIPVKDGGWVTIAPSAIPYKQGEDAPEEMTKKQIDQLLNDFAAAARRSYQAGFEVLEIHAAHGYLLNEFLSPLSNFRNDEYGGSFDNRCRLLFEVIDAIKKEWPEDLPIFIRISATDWVEGGWTIEDSVNLSRKLKIKNIDLIDCSSAGNSPLQKINPGPLYQLPFAERIKRESGIATGAVGMITNSEEAQNIIFNNQADLVFLARQLLREPYFPLHAAKQLGKDIAWSNQYLRAK